MDRRGLLGSIVAAPAVAVGALRKSSGLGRFLAGSMGLGELKDAPAEIGIGRDQWSSVLGANEAAEFERTYFDLVADEYAAIQKGTIGKSEYSARYSYSASRPGPTLDFRAPPGDDRGFPDVGEL